MPDPATAVIAGSSLLGAGASLYGSNKAAGAAEDASKASIAESRRQFDLVRGDTAPYRAAGVGALSKLSQLYGLGPISGAAGAAPQVGTRTFKPSELESLLKQGYKVDDILKIGTFEPNAKTSDINYLMQRYGLSPNDVNRLQHGTFSPPAAGTPGASAAPDMSVFFESPDYQFNLAEGQKAIDRSLVARGRALSGAGVREGVRYASGLASREFGSFYDRLANLAGIGQTGVAQSAAAGGNAAANIGAAYQYAGNARGSAYMSAAQGANNAVQGGIGNYLLMNYLKPGGVSSGIGYMPPGGG